MKPSEVLIVQPREDFHFLGTDIKLNKAMHYTAIHATNQQNWKKDGKIFIQYGFREDEWTPVLSKADYRIIRK